MRTYLEIDDTERGFLLGILTERLESLREEVQHTDTRAYKEGLNADRAALQKLIDRIRAEEDKMLAGKVKSYV